MLEQTKKLSPQEEYSLNKQLFSGFPKYMATGSTLQQLMHNNMLSGIEEDYNDFIRSCPDTTLTNPVKRTYDKLLPFEAGKNIRETGLITDNLQLKKEATESMSCYIYHLTTDFHPVTSKMHSTCRNNSKKKGYPPWSALNYIPDSVPIMPNG